MVFHRIAFVSTFPPRRCHIANYTHDLIHAIDQQPGPSLQPVGVAVVDSGTLTYGEPVRFLIRREKPKDYRRTADALNAYDVDLVCVQHAFDIYGGPNNAGEYLGMLLSRLDAPVITTLHTIPEKPSSEHFRMVRTITRHSAKTVVITQNGMNVLQRIYGVSTSKIVVIPHGVPDRPFVSTETSKQKLGLGGWTTIMTSGLTDSGEGIETVLKALPEIIEYIPNVLYIVLDATQPNQFRVTSESDRRQLEVLVRELNLERHVVFQNRFEAQQSFDEYLLGADFYVAPYTSEQQVTDATLAYAVGTGRVVISTPHVYARELLSDGSGRIVPFGDPKAITNAIVELYKDSRMYQKIREKAFNKSRKMTWTVVGRTYRELLSAAKGDGRILEFPAPSAAQAMHQTSLVS